MLRAWAAFTGRAAKVLLAWGALGSVQHFHRTPDTSCSYLLG